MNVRTYRILMIAPTSFFADYGCHVRILEEIRALQARGHRVRVATYHNGDDVEGVDIRRTVGLPWRKRPMVGSSRHKLYLDVMLFGETFLQALRFRPDVIHAHLHEGALIGSVVGALLRKPVVFDYQGSLVEEMLDHRFIRPGGLRERVIRRVERLIDRLPGMIVPSGTSAVQHLIRSGVARRRIRLVADAVDTNRFNPANAASARERVRNKLGIPPSARVVVYLGLLAEYQGTSLLIDAARELLERHPDMYVVIAGYPGVDRYAKLASSLTHADRILFPGRIPYSDAPELLTIGDVAVAPKTSSTEGNGKLFNYMAMRLPTVAIDTRPNREILGDLGHLVSPNATELAEAIEAALSDSDVRRAALRQRVSRHFSWSKQVEILESVYARVTGTEALDQTLNQPNGAGADPADSTHILEEDVTTDRELVGSTRRTQR